MDLSLADRGSRDGPGRDASLIPSLTVAVTLSRLHSFTQSRSNMSDSSFVLGEQMDLVNVRENG